MFYKTLLALILIFAGSVAVSDAQELKPVKLPDPVTTGSKPLMQALKERCTTRSFKPDTLSTQTLSDLLWAAFGINRPDSGRRTAPSALNRQEIDIYVVLEKGLYLYDASENTLLPVIAGDIRQDTGKQDYVKDAPVNLVFVADYSKMGDGPENEKIHYSSLDTGYIAQNVYLYCASAGLGTVSRGYFDSDILSKKMNLRPEQTIVLTQTVGYIK